jgi:hypothetical protein
MVTVAPMSLVPEYVCAAVTVGRSSRSTSARSYPSRRSPDQPGIVTHDSAWYVSPPTVKVRPVVPA